jgi:hypothetical protein
LLLMAHEISPGLTAVQQAREAGVSFHDMPPEALGFLTEFGFFTVTEGRHPGPYAEFLQEYGQERTLGIVASRAADALLDVPECTEAVYQGRAGTQLAEACNAVTAIHGEDIHLAGVRTGGHAETVTAKTITYTLSDADAAVQLSSALQVLTRNRRRAHPVVPDLRGSEPTVRVHHMSEHGIRSFGRAVGALVAAEDQQRGAVLPPSKRSLQFWKEEQHETFPPWLEDRLQAVDAAYLALTKTATYRGRPDLHPRARGRIIGTDAAAMFQGTRDIFNGYIWTLREGGSHLNPEQDPDVPARSFLEDGIELVRDEATLESVRYGPMPSRALTPSERLTKKGREALVHTRSDPYHAALELAGAALGGLVDVSIAALQYAPAVGRAGRQLARDTNEWRMRKKAVAATDARIDALVARLLK